LTSNKSNAKNKGGVGDNAAKAQVMVKRGTQKSSRIEWRTGHRRGGSCRGQNWQDQLKERSGQRGKTQRRRSRWGAEAVAHSRRKVRQDEGE